MIKIEIEYVALIAISIVFYFGVTFDYVMRRDFDVSFLNPIVNYKNWRMLNWFGIGMMTLFLNVIFIPYSVIYWLVKLIYFLITVGRKKD